MFVHLTFVVPSMKHLCLDPVCGAMFASELRLNMHLARWHLSGVEDLHPSLKDQRKLFDGDLQASDLPKPVSSLVEPHPELPYFPPGTAGVGMPRTPKGT